MTVITPSATMIEARLTDGKLLEGAPDCSVTQLLLIASFGPSAYAMLVRSGWPSVE